MINLFQFNESCANDPQPSGEILGTGRKTCNDCIYDDQHVLSIPEHPVCRKTNPGEAIGSSVPSSNVFFAGLSACRLPPIARSGHSQPAASKPD